MKKIKAVIASALALSCIPFITGCEDEISSPNTTSQGNQSAPQGSTPSSAAGMDSEDASAVAGIDIEAEPLENPTVKFLSEWDLNPAEGQPVSVALEMFQTKFGGRIEQVFTGFDDRFSKLTAMIGADEAPDMFSAGDMDIFPRGVISGQFQPLDPYIDFGSDLWKPMKQVNDLFSTNGKHYVGAIDVESDCVMFYSKKTIINNGLADPAQLFAEGKWDWEALWNMMTSFCDRTQEKFATDGWWFESAISTTTGYPYIGMNNGEIVHNLDNGMLEKAQEYMLNMKNNDLPFPKSEYGWKVYPGNIKNGTLLFYPIGTYALYPYNNIIQNFGEMEDIMFVPLPKCPYADAYYLPARVSGFAIPKGASNPKGTAAYLTCAMASRDSDVAKEIGKRQAFEEYGWTQEQWDMFEKVADLTAAHPVVEVYNAVSPNLADLINNPMKEAYNAGKSWVSTRDSIRSMVETELADANEKLKKASQ